MCGELGRPPGTGLSNAELTGRPAAVSQAASQLALPQAGWGSAASVRTAPCHHVLSPPQAPGGGPPSEGHLEGSPHLEIESSLLVCFFCTLGSRALVRGPQSSPHSRGSLLPLDISQVSSSFTEPVAAGPCGGSHTHCSVFQVRLWR